MAGSPFRRGEQGYSMAWYAVVLLFVLAPLMSLAVDITRLLFVRTDLQTSVDAACEAAALAADTRVFSQTGVQQIDPGLAGRYATQAFYASAAEAGLVQYSASLTSVTVFTPTEVRCAAIADVVPFIPYSPHLEVRVYAQAKMRFLES
jgi:uncharacterized membrane protein